MFCFVGKPRDAQSADKTLYSLIEISFMRTNDFFQAYKQKLSFDTEISSLQELT